jgi:ribosomal protein L20A (L18A)
MYKEFRELSRVGAVEALYQDLAARHRARFRSVHVSCELIGGSRGIICSS